jgi:tripartite-type tricarboxylate transporter receptor subunit TctC
MLFMVLRTLILFLVALPAAAQDYPAREIRSICNFAAGSGADIVVRFYSDRLSRLAGKPVVVDNKPGNQGTVATDFVAKSKPDGYTIMITPASSTLATAPHIFKSLPFDPAKDFAPVTTITSLSFVIAVDAAKPVRTIPESDRP